jgi:hypothetical protein
MCTVLLPPGVNPIAVKYIITVTGFKTRQSIQNIAPERLDQTWIGSEYCLDVFKNTREAYDNAP